MEAVLDLQIEDYAHELLAEMPVFANEINQHVQGNQVTIIFRHEGDKLPVTVEITFDETPKSLQETFIEKLSEAIEARESEEK